MSHTDCHTLIDGGPGLSMRPGRVYPCRVAQGTRAEGGSHVTQQSEVGGLSIPDRVECICPARWPYGGACPWCAPFDAPQPYRPERLVLASAFVDELDREGLEVGGVHRLPSGNYVLDLIPKEPEDPSDG